MKNNILKFFFLFLALILFIVVYFSTIGIETDRFNNQIKQRIIENNKNIDLDLKKNKINIKSF